MWARNVAHRVLVRKPEGKRLLGRPGNTWEDNTKMILKKQVRRACIAFLWFRTETGVGLLRTR
jgi:hypothetical protein